MQLIQRIMQLVQCLHLLIPSIRFSTLQPEEGTLRGKLEETKEIKAWVKGWLNELWALIGALDAGVRRPVHQAGLGVSEGLVQGGAADRATKFDKKFAGGSGRFECCFWEIECKYDIGRGC